MTISRLVINNYRSIEHLDLDFGVSNAFVGPNNAGKSNILRALDLVLGDTWPTRPFEDRDFFNHDTTRTIEIVAFFDAALACDLAVRGFRLAYDAAHGVEYCAVDAAGAVCLWPRGNPKRVSNDMRAEVALLYLELDRESEKQLRVNPWTLYGKLLRRIEAGITAADRGAFVAAVNAAMAAHLTGYLNAAQTSMSDLVQQQTGLGVTLGFRMIDPMEALKGVRPVVVDGATNTDPDDVGAGVQSALAIAIAKTYADIVRTPLMIAIEEPELFLHPHGTRHFYRLLKGLAATGLQVVYATHEKAFVSAGDHQAIRIVRKIGGRTIVSSGSGIVLAGIGNTLQLQSKFNERLNEAFFASVVVLVEGDADEIAVKCAFEILGLEIDRQSISVLGVGGIGEIRMIAALLIAFNIPTIAIIDEDPGNPTTAAASAQIVLALGAANVFTQSPNIETLFGLASKPKKVTAMTAIPAWFAANAPQPVYVDAAARVQALAP